MPTHIDSHPHLQSHTAQVANSEGIQAVRSRAQDNATSLDFWHDMHGSGEGSRFSAHADFDVKHDKAMAEESAR